MFSAMQLTFLSSNKQISSLNVRVEVSVSQKVRN